MDVEILSRLQFAGTIMFHYLFPPLTIGLGLIMVILEGIWLRTRNQSWNYAARFWTRIFALNFALGVATGIVMEFEFGTNWAAYSRFVGDVFGSALAAEGIFAFFLESGFLAVLVFGWDRVGPKMHFFSTLMVFFGSCFSAVWIVVANSWQQTPAGYHVVETNVNGVPGLRAEITDFWAMIFNPSSVDRLSHTLIGAMIMGAFFVCSVCAYYLIKERHELFARRCFTIGVLVACVFSPLALLTGHDQAHQVATTQPAKLAAYEGHFETGPRRSLSLGMARCRGRGGQVRNRGPGHAQLSDPLGLRRAGHRSRRVPRRGQAGCVATVSDVSPDDCPGHGIHRSDGLYPPTATKRACLSDEVAAVGYVFSVFGAVVANQAGWVAAETGRQPWIVYPSVQDGVEMPGLRTSDALSESVKAGQVAWSMAMFGLIYASLFAVWIFVLNSKIQHGPDKGASPPARPGGFFGAAAALAGENQSLLNADTNGQERDNA